LVEINLALHSQFTQTTEYRRDITISRTARLAAGRFLRGGQRCQCIGHRLRYSTVRAGRHWISPNRRWARHAARAPARSGSRGGPNTSRRPSLTKTPVVAKLRHLCWPTSTIWTHMGPLSMQSALRSTLLCALLLHLCHAAEV